MQHVVREIQVYHYILWAVYFFTHPPFAPVSKL